jgi:hypothetical protein
MTTKTTSTVRSVAAAASVIGLSVIAPMAGAACAPKARCAAKVAKCGACKAKCGACAAKCTAKCGACKAKCGACAAKCGACKAKCSACAAKCGACKAKCGACAAGGKLDPKLVKRPAGYTPAKLTNGLVAKGWKLFKDTSLSSNGLSCNTCHIGNASYNDTFKSPYPHFVQMAKDRFDLDQVEADEMVQMCMVIPMAAQPLAWNSTELAALTAYVEKVRTTTFNGAVGGGAKCGACSAKCGATKCGACAPKCGACKPKCKAS